MTISVNFLSHGGTASELRTLFRQLALLWKFELRELPADGSGTITAGNTPLIVDLGACPADYQEVVAHYIKDGLSRTLLFASQSVNLQPALKSLSGVNAVSWQGYDSDLSIRKIEDDPLLDSLSGRLRVLRFNDSSAGNIETDNAVILLQAENGMNLLSRSGKCYTIALPVWQFGIVSFAAWFTLMENALFFNDKAPHLSPGPYVALRIDDLPVTGESYLKQGYSDTAVCSEIREIQATQRLYGSRIEYMLSSHVISRDGAMIKAPEVAPNAFKILRELYSRRDINVGVHGFLHLDPEEYRRNCRIVPHEFLALNENETQATLRVLKDWLKDLFGKDRPGFVAPAWGYKDFVTKPIARGMFRYVADSNQHLQESEGKDLFGTVIDGCVSLFETWRSGMAGIRMANNDMFRAYLSVGFPIHLMLHGSFPRDPLTTRLKTLILVSFAFLSVALNIWLGCCLDKMIFLSLILLQVTAGIIVFRKSRQLGRILRLLLSRLPLGESVNHLARAAQQAGAEWVFVEELADHMAGYDSVSVQSATMSGNRMTVLIACAKKLARPISVHFPFAVVEASVYPEVRNLFVKGSVVRFGPLDDRTYKIATCMEVFYA